MKNYSQSFRTNNPVYKFREISWSWALLIMGLSILIINLYDLFKKRFINQLIQFNPTY